MVMLLSPRVLERVHKREELPPPAPTPGLPDSQVSRRELGQLKWLRALVPGMAVLSTSTTCQDALEHVLPALSVQYGNLVASPTRNWAHPSRRVPTPPASGVGHRDHAGLGPRSPPRAATS